MISTSTIIISILYLCYIQYTVADCIDGKLYCFNSKQIQLGEIIVGQCWNWRRLTCEPCGSKLINKKISFHRYLLICRHYYRGTVKVLDTKSVWAHKVKEIINSY
jgi:hypothetical protein